MRSSLFKKGFKINLSEKRALIFFEMFLLLFLVFLYSSPLVLAEEDSNVTTKEDASAALERIETIRDKMSNEGFNVMRINDTLSTAKEIFVAQESRESRGRKADYSKVIPHKESSEKFYEQAVIARDKLYSLELGVKKLEDKGINSSEAQVILDRIEKEIQDERYEKALELVPSAEEKISDLEAEHTAAKVFYEATTSSVFGFISDYYKQTIVVIVVLFILYILLRKKIWSKYYNKKIRNLEEQKTSINSLIKKVQSSYFEKGNISESNYNICSKKYAELIRDLDRRIPLYQEKINRIYEENVFMKPTRLLKSGENEDFKKKKSNSLGSNKNASKHLSRSEKKRKKKLDNLKKKNDKEKKRLEKQAKRDMKKKKKELKKLKKKRKKTSGESKKRYASNDKKKGKKFKKSKKQ